ncbi:hypothetical protein NF212_20465 [Parasalinivibrio latis]|uniref:hypothetical protein n=1 Tax=Parasalinivibrio latis TaxID=2952610 RepID=UPI0030DEEFFB
MLQNTFNISSQLTDRLTTADKYRKLIRLARKRRYLIPAGYHSIGEYHGSIYECEWVSPYTKSASNLNADVMIILKDWCPDEHLSGPLVPALVRHGLDPALPTQDMLEKLLNTHFQIHLCDTFCTTLFPFVKPGAFCTTIPEKLLINSALDFALPQIKAIQPKLVIAMGLNVYNALAKSKGLPLAETLEEAINNPFQIPLPSGECSIVYAQSHIRGEGQKSLAEITMDWIAMKECINLSWAESIGIND